MNATFRQSSWIVTPCLGAIAATYLMLVWLPSRRVIKQWHDEVEARQKVVTGATGVAATLAAVEQELDKSREAVADWEKVAPGKRDIPALYGGINALAKETGLTITRFDPQAIQVYEKVQVMPIAVVGNGTFAQLFEFLRLIEALPVTIWVDSLRLEKQSQNGKDIQCELNFAVFSNNQQSSDYVKHIE